MNGINSCLATTFHKASHTRCGLDADANSFPVLKSTHDAQRFSLTHFRLKRQKHKAHFWATVALRQKSRCSSYAQHLFCLGLFFWRRAVAIIGDKDMKNNNTGMAVAREGKKWWWKSRGLYYCLVSGCSISMIKSCGPGLLTPPQPNSSYILRVFWGLGSLRTATRGLRMPTTGRP